MNMLSFPPPPAAAATTPSAVENSHSHFLHDVTPVDDQGTIQMIHSWNQKDLKDFLVAPGDFPVDMVSASVHVLVNIWNEEMAQAGDRSTPRFSQLVDPCFTEGLLLMKRQGRELEQQCRTLIEFNTIRTKNV